jgi:hypothetical protein
MSPPYDASLFYRIVSDDASSPGGAPAACALNIAAAQRQVIGLGGSGEGLALLSKTFGVCQRHSRNGWLTPGPHLRWETSLIPAPTY